MVLNVVTLATGQAVALYLLPLVVVLGHLRARGPLSWAIAIPVTVAADLLFVLLVARFAPLEEAVILVRVAWLGGALASFLATSGQDSPAKRIGLQRRDLWITAAAAAGALVQSLSLSRTYNIWDRAWHVPLVASLRGQTLPFRNVFEPYRVLHYHFSGDVLAASLQILSGSTIHALRALSVAHDLIFALTGACIALLLLGMGKRRGLPIVVCAWGITLSGPFITFSGRFNGYSILNFVSMSFRPHVSLFGLLCVGFAALVGARSRGAVSSGGLAALLATLIALAGITDEVSTALLVAAMGAVWLIEPNFLHRRRLMGFLILVLFVFALLVPNLLFHASLSPGGPASVLSLVPPRSPGYGNRSPLSLGSAGGVMALLSDSLPTLTALAALFLFRVPDQATDARAVRVLLGALVAGSLLGLTCLELNHSPQEAHRFMSAALLLTPLLALAFAQTPRLGTVLLATSLAVGATSTLAWMVFGAPIKARQLPAVGPYSLDCREATGAEFGQRPAPAYVSPAIWPAYSGCRPVFTAGAGESATWEMKVSGPLLGPDAAPLVRKMLAPGRAFMTVCAAAGDTDTLCARASSECVRAGTSAIVCTESAGLTP